MINNNIGVIIPAHNEGEALANILKDLKTKGLRTLVVDDGSKDDTYHIAKSYADIVLKNETNFGKGQSLQRGINYFLEEDKVDYIITMDGDGQHAVSDIDIFLKAAQDKESFVIGNRMLNPLGMPKVRIFTNKLMSSFISKIVNQKIPDTQCGFRLIRKDVLENTRLKTNKFEVESELIIKAADNVKIKSVPIKSIYAKNQKSRINPIMDTLRFLKFIFSLLGHKK